MSDQRTTRTTGTAGWSYVKSAVWLVVSGCVLKGATLPDLGLLPHSVETMMDAAGMVAGVWIVVREMPKWRLS
jgi:hypothetical protein